jgi:protein required for attachment to host cells
MTTTWILIANRSSASLFESDWPGKSMRRVQDITHPKGRMQNKDIDADKPSRSFDSFGKGRHAMSTEQEPTEHIAQQFALDLAELLNKGRVTHAYDKLVLMAEPKFLGVLRAALDKNTAALVVQTVNKELLNVKEEDLAKYLQ